MKLASVIGIILMVLGIVALAYQVSPVRFLLQATEPHKPNLVRPILGGAALLAGVALLYASRPKQS